MKTGAFQISGAVAGKQHDNAGISVIVQSVLKHPQLQQPIGHFLLAPFPATAVEQGDFNSVAFHPVPELPHLRGNQTRGQGSLNRSVGVCQPKHVVEVHADPKTCIRAFRPFLGKALRFMKDVRVVPIDEYVVHVPEPSC